MVCPTLSPPESLFREAAETILIVGNNVLPRPPQTVTQIQSLVMAYLAGHRDMAITKRYMHPQAETIREAVEKARVGKSGHNSGHTRDVAATARIGDTAAAA